VSYCLVYNFEVGKDAIPQEFLLLSDYFLFHSSEAQAVTQTLILYGGSDIFDPIYLKIVPLLYSNTAQAITLLDKDFKKDPAYTKLMVKVVEKLIKQR
jgi:hypothetical protein